MFSVCIPCIGQFVFLYIIISTYSNLQFIRPETHRNLLRDILLCILTCGLYTLVLPYLLLRETEQGAQRMKVTIGNFKSMGMLVGVANLFLYPFIISLIETDTPIFFLLYLIMNQLVISF